MHGCQESKLLELHGITPSFNETPSCCSWWHFSSSKWQHILLLEETKPEQGQAWEWAERSREKEMLVGWGGLTYGPIFAKFRDVHLHAPRAPKLAEFCQDLPEQTELKVLKSSVWDTIIDSKIANQIHHLRFDPRAEAGPLSNPARLDNPTWQLSHTVACEPAMWGRNREEWTGSLQIVFPGRWSGCCN